MSDAGGDSALASSGSAADEGFSPGPPGQSVQECAKKTWVGIELVDSDGNPVANEPYVLELPDGSTKEGTLDAQGTAGVSGVDPGTCKVKFPRLDGRSWKPL